MFLDKALIWWLVNLFSIVVLAFYSMMEMACVSFNQVRLQFYVSEGKQRAKWLQLLLNDPSRLFGTTLIMVNLALFAGSEFSRQSYEAMGLSPDLAPLTQVALVMIFGELAPMFAARRYAEHMAMLGAPLLYFSATLLKPFIIIVQLISKGCNKILGGEEDKDARYLTVEELQYALAEHEEDRAIRGDPDEFNAISTNILRLRHKETSQIMTPINLLPLISIQATVGQVKTVFARTKSPFVLLYKKATQRIVKIVFPKQLLEIPENQNIALQGVAPWYVTGNLPLIEILKQFRSNSQGLAVVLDDQGLASGVVTLEDVIGEIFGKFSKISKKGKRSVLIDRTLDGDTTVEDFYQEFEIELDQDRNLTLGALIENKLQRRAEVGDVVWIPPIELEVKEATLLEIKSILVTTRT